VAEGQTLVVPGGLVADHSGRGHERWNLSDGGVGTSINGHPSISRQTIILGAGRIRNG